MGAAINLVDWSLLETVFDHLRRRNCRYKFGAKAPSLDADTEDCPFLDCSGFTRFAIAKASEQRVIIPDGSVAQHDWCDESDFRRLAHYSDCGYAAHDPRRWFMAFLEPHAGRAGHVWLVNAGKTRESCGSLGVASRPYDTKVLLARCCAAYEVTRL